MPNRFFAVRPSAARLAARAACGLLPVLLLSAPASSTAADPEPEAPPAFELLERVRARYGGLEAYAGAGELEVRRGPGEGEPAARYRLSTVKGEDGSFRLELEEEAADREPRAFLLWGGGEETFVYDSARGAEGEFRAVGSPLAALAELPGGRELGIEAFPLSALLLGGDGALPRPPAASVDGPEPCPGTPDAPCWRLSHPSADGRVETVLWVETGEPVVRRAEVRTVADPPGFAAALADAGLDPDAGPADPERVVVRTSLTEDAFSSFGVTLRLALGAPERARRVERWSAQRRGPQTTFGETIDVSLAGFVVRVLDSGGRPVTGLGPEDFLVFAGDREVPVRSVDFYARGSGPLAPPGRPRAEAAEARPGEPPPPPPELPPKIVVLYVQADFNGLRVRGHLKMLPYVERFLEALPPDDLVAVVSFDSHLEPWLDLTTDREAAQEAVWRAIHFGADPPSGRRTDGGRGGAPSLFAGIDPDEAADAAWAEKGLEIVGRALGRLPGEKAVVFLGWGLGRYGSGGVTMRRDYRPAVDALTAARASVFVLDVADAEYHDLEVGLRRVAAETGGTYQKTYEFPIQATRRLAALLASHYVLTVDVADLPPAAREGRQELEVQLVGHDGVRLLVRPLSGG